MCPFASRFVVRASTANLHNAGFGAKVDRFTRDPCIRCARGGKPSLCGLVQAREKAAVPALGEGQPNRSPRPCPAPERVRIRYPVARAQPPLPLQFMYHPDGNMERRTHFALVRKSAPVNEPHFALVRKSAPVNEPHLVCRSGHVLSRCLSEY
jgi:hypothetical protein